MPPLPRMPPTRTNRQQGRPPNAHARARHRRAPHRLTPPAPRSIGAQQDRPSRMRSQQTDEARAAQAHLPASAQCCAHAAGFGQRARPRTSRTRSASVQRGPSLAATIACGDGHDAHTTAACSTTCHTGRLSGTSEIHSTDIFSGSPKHGASSAVSLAQRGVAGTLGSCKRDGYAQLWHDGIGRCGRH